MKLYHFTCEHSASQIRRDMILKPHTQIQLDGRALIWFTDLDSPSRDAIGLTSVHLTCDRMAWRVTTEAMAARWPDYLRRQPREFREAARALLGPESLPMHWFVSRWPVAVQQIEASVHT